MALWLSFSLWGLQAPLCPYGAPEGACLRRASGWLRLRLASAKAGLALVGFRLASLRLSAGFCLGFLLDVGLLLARFGFLLSCTLILAGFDLILASAGFRLESALV